MSGREHPRLPSIYLSWSEAYCGLLLCMKFCASRLFIVGKISNSKCAIITGQREYIDSVLHYICGMEPELAEIQTNGL